MWVCRDAPTQTYFSIFNSPPNALSDTQISFNYIVKKQEQQKICFGSGRSRNIGLRTGTSPFMRFYMSEDFPNTGPGRYDVPGAFKAVTSKPCVKSFSLKGYGGLGRFAVSIAHTEDYPAPCEYNVPLFPDKVKESKVPFGSTAKRKGFDTNRNPGISSFYCLICCNCLLILVPSLIYRRPGLYRNITPLTRRIIFDHSFGGRVNLRLGVEIKCCKRNTDTCGICEENPIGDYWHLNNRMYLCRGCMTVERQRPRKHTKKELSNFRKIRDCSMIHSHEGTDAKIWLMHPGVIQKWSQKEAYLSSYFKD
ncbi:uncharacterized protein LOC135167954 [Diachasmimorpha longicaudata]|uniref:uncharacterized protein LOC135167954 n=1 Tax=Diachasmimorpha longicaudata TaxID=58733 RepID=UPI0030B8B0AC